jgi:hypothetical protein
MSSERPYQASIRRAYVGHPAIPTMGLLGGPGFPLVVSRGEIRLARLVLVAAAPSSLASTWARERKGVTGMSGPDETGGSGKLGWIFALAAALTALAALITALNGCGLSS